MVWYVVAELTVIAVPPEPRARLETTRQNFCVRSWLLSPVVSHTLTAKRAASRGEGQPGQQELLQPV